MRLTSLSVYMNSFLQKKSSKAGKSLDREETGRGTWRYSLFLGVPVPGSPIIYIRKS